MIEEWAYINAANDYLLQQHKFLDDELSDDMKIGFGEETWRDNCGMLLERSQLLQNIKYENDLFDLLVRQIYILLTYILFQLVLVILANALAEEI